jgi:hypothetical protein
MLLRHRSCSDPVVLQQTQVHRAMHTIVEDIVMRAGIAMMSQPSDSEKVDTTDLS